MLPKMYTEFAELWTLISDPYDYTEEALFIRDVLIRKLPKNKRKLLGACVGGGIFYHISLMNFRQQQ